LSVTNSFSLLHEAAKQLGAVVTQKFDEAVRAEDLASVERFFKIFPLLGMQDEGLAKFSLYLCSKVTDSKSVLLHSYLFRIQCNALLKACPVEK
jgi:COG4 transport protein.